MRLGVFFALAALPACETAPSWEPVQWNQLSASEKQNAIQRISNVCSLPADRVLLDGNMLAVRPAPNDEYTKVDCLLGGLRSLKGAELGFIGNDAFAPIDKEK